MTPPILISLLIATLYGCAFHACFGRRLWQWPLFWGVALLGFFGGIVFGVGLDLDWLKVGSIPLVTATAGSFVCLALAWFFSEPYARRATD